MPKLSNGTSPSSHNRNRQDPTANQIKAKVKRSLATLDKSVTAFILSEEYKEMTPAKRSKFCRELLEQLMDGLLLPHFESQHIQFGLEGYIHKLVHQHSVRPPKEVYIDKTQMEP